MRDTLEKVDILKMLDLNVNKWREIKGNEAKGHKQDVTHENFIDNVILVYEWIIRDVERM